MLYVIGPAVAGNANLQQNDFVAGMPSPLAALGFAGALARKINAEFGLDVDPWAVRVMPIYHAVSPSVGRVKPAAKRGARQTMEATEIAESTTGEVILSLVVEIDGALDAARMAEIADRMRFAGSAIFPYRPGAAVPVRRLEGKTLADLRLPRGYAMVPPAGRERGRITSFGEPETLNVLAEALTGKSEKGEGYLVPCAIGLRLLETPEEAGPRKGARDPEIPHVFAEPGVGLAELASIRTPDLARAHPSDLAARMWRWAPDATHRHVMFSEHHLACI